MEVVILTVKYVTNVIIVIYGICYVNPKDEGVMSSRRPIVKIKPNHTSQHAKHVVPTLHSTVQAITMCACKQKKSFFIEDILQDVKKKPYKNLSNEPTKPLTCSKTTPQDDVDVDACEDKTTKFNVICEVQKEMEISKINLEQRRNTYPLYPTPIKANIPWPQYRGKDSAGYVEPRPFTYYSDPMLNTNQILRNQLAANRYITHPFAIRQAYGFDRVSSNCCNPWWGLGGRRKGGQVRFTAAQTGALERRFNASKYLSPDERRTLASTLRLSDRQVKTWFQNRRAKWRRTTPDSADAGSPPTADEASDDEVHIADEY